MAAARNVYILIVGMMALPTVFYSLRKRANTPKGSKKRAGLLGLMCALLVLWVVIGAMLYRYTIDRQPLIVAERAAVSLYQAGLAGDDLKAALVREGIGGETLAVEGAAQGPWASFAGADILLPQKSLTIEGATWSPVVLENEQGQRLLLALRIDDAAPKSKVLRARLYWPQEIGDLLARITFFAVDTLR